MSSSGYKVISFAILFAIGAMGGLMFQMLQYPQGARFWPFDLKERQPQSIPSETSGREFVPSALTMAMKDKFFNSMVVEVRSERAMIVQGQKEQKELCAVYDTASLEFEADGIVVEGESPTLKISGPCAAQFMDVPFRALTTGRPSDSEMKFNTSEGQIKVTMRDLPTVWPRKWTLRKVTYLNHNRPGENLVLTTFEKGMGRRRQIVMNW
jgi:hypothetical protein